MKKESYLWDRMARAFHTTSLRSKAHRDKYYRVADIVLKHDPKTVLDLGSGSGILEKELLDQGFEGKIVSYDVSDPMLEIAREFVNSPKVEFLKADLDKDIPTSEKFDVIVSINLLFFLDNKEAFLKNVSNRLKDKNSLFIMIAPKPYDQASNWEFIKEHFSDTNWWEKVLITINEIINLPRYVKMAYEQRKLTLMAKNGQIVYHHPEKIKEMAERANLNIISVEDIHAKQNWLILLRRG